jgi:radical SAM protein with 4Fe4S-binding SPASM domain
MIRRAEFVNTVHDLYQEVLCRPPCSRAVTRHLWKRALLGFSTQGFKEMLENTEESRLVIGPLKTRVREVYRQIAGDSPTPAEVQDCVDRFRTRFPSFEEQVQRIGSGRFDRYLGIRPLKLEVDLTSQCNLRCIMCYFVLDRFSKRKRVDLTVAEFEKLADQILPYCSRVSLSIGTEPMLNKDLPEIMEILATYEVPWTYMSTNALLLTPAMAETMVDTGFNALAVSVDAATKETYERIRFGGNFNKLVKKIKMLQAMKADRGARFPVINLNYVLMKSNIDELPRFVELAHELGVEGIAAMHVTPFDGVGMEEECLNQDAEWFNRRMEEARVLACELGIEVAFPPKFEIMAAPAELAPVTPVGFQLNVDPSRRSSNCVFPWHFVGIDPYGNVLPCGWWYTEMPMGNIHQDRFLDLWNGPAWAELRLQHEQGQLRDTCKTCPAAGMGNVNNTQAFAKVRLGE